MSSPSRKTQKPDTVRIITRDLIRDLKIPSKDPSGLSVFLHPTEIERITTASRVSTKEELEATLDAQRREREAAMDAAEDRKAHICQADLSCQKNQDLSDLEAEAKERAQYLLERANAMRMEQEDEVKKLNELILDAHCHAVRDAQILERQQILAELQDEERRLDAMMEVDHRRALEALEQIDELRKHQRIQGNQLIINQIEERLEDRMLQNEMKGHEGQQMLERMQMEELEALVRKKEEQQRLQEILRINEDRLLAKERKKEDYEHLHNRDKEGDRLDEEARHCHIDEIKEKQLRELKAAGPPEKYCNKVERRVHALPALAH
ncbi:cilia- and flagella-associated protein 45 isoform X2 [Oncorhynchus kisutch]|uniref:Cilia- and flagella-associated protein 45 n=1 Tax=Oncorhynchus kisutch TaxID=8019 RepID=A0A8C7IDW8_ONCKI|nr:cilia- and flagella-associated protein 45 isoform X2 [Oncorhynchus kisutch]